MRWSTSRGPQPAALTLMAVAAISGAATEGSATGAPMVDRLLRGGLAAVVTAAAAMAPTWAVVVLAIGAAGLGWTGGLLTAASGASALGLAMLLVWKDDGGRHLLKAAIGGLAITALLRVPGGQLGATAAATGVLTALIALTAFGGAGPRRRRRAVLALAGLLGLGAVASALGALAGLSARSSFERSSTGVEAALDSARAGGAPAAAESARTAAGDLTLARSSLRAWWARPAWAVPVVGAHLRAADRVAASAGPAVEAAAGSAEVLRLDALRPATGGLDLDRVAAAEPELAGLSTALHNAKRGVAGARSPWLVAPFQERLQRYDVELAEVTTTADRALLAVRTLPSLLGRDRPTRWFVAVASPAESRELGGFIGEYALLVADKGTLRLDRSGPVEDIGSRIAGRNLIGVDLPGRYLDQRPEVFWENLSGYPDLPTVAAAARTLWDQTVPGAPLDGLVYIDPHGLAALLRLTGPVDAPPIGSVTAENAAQLLLVDQYAQFDERDARKDALQAVTAATFTRLSTAPLPAPGDVGAALGAAARGGHLIAASFSAEGQTLFDEIGAAGRLPVADGGDLASLRTTNLAPNKLDAHVRRSVRYQAVVDPGSGQVEATVTIELRNDATPDLPDYAANNYRGLPKGTHLLEVGWYSGLRLQAVEVDGRPVASTSDRERGWWTHSTTVELPPVSMTTVVIRLAGELEATGPYRLAVAPQAAAGDDVYAIEVVGVGPWVTGPVAQPQPGRSSTLNVPFRRT